MEKKTMALIWEHYGGRILGTMLGIIFGIVFLFVGFWKTLFFAILVGVGYYIGKQLDVRDDLKQVLDRILLDKWMKK